MILVVLGRGTHQRKGNNGLSNQASSLQATLVAMLELVKGLAMAALASQPHWYQKRTSPQQNHVTDPMAYFYSDYVESWREGQSRWDPPGGCSS